MFFSSWREKARSQSRLSEAEGSRRARSPDPAPRSSLREPGAAGFSGHLRGGAQVPQAAPQADGCTGGHGRPGPGRRAASARALEPWAHGPRLVPGPPVHILTQDLERRTEPASSRRLRRLTWLTSPHSPGAASWRGRLWAGPRADQWLSGTATPPGSRGRGSGGAQARAVTLHITPQSVFTHQIH